MTTEDHLRLFRNLRTLRKAAGYTQTQLAEKIGMCRTAYGQLERGSRLLDLNTLYSLSQLYHIPVDALVNCDIQEIRNNYFLSQDGALDESALRNLYSKLTADSKQKLMERAEELYMLDTDRRKKW